MRTPLAISALLLLANPGCVGNIRETTSPRTATEMLLVSTAAARAVWRYDAAPLAGRRVYVDLSNFESIDKGFVSSALRDHLSGAGAILVDEIEPAGELPGADVVVEVRNGALGIYDGDFTLGIPQLPVTVPGLTTALVTPSLYIFRRDTAQGWAKFNIWAYDPKTRRYLSRSDELWGQSYYNQWFWFGIGPFDGSNDIFPEWSYEEVIEDEQEKTSSHPERRPERPPRGRDEPPVRGQAPGDLDAEDDADAPPGGPPDDTQTPPR